MGCKKCNESGGKRPGRKKKSNSSFNSPTQAEIAHAQAREYIKNHDGWTPEDMIQKLFMLLDGDQANDILGVKSDGGGVGVGCCYKIDKSDLHGLGVFAIENKLEGDDLFSCVSLGGVRITNAFSLLNHSDEPNSEIRVKGDEAWLFSLKEISEGEEFTVDYSNLPWLMIFDRRKPGWNRTGETVPPPSGEVVSEEV